MTTATEKLLQRSAPCDFTAAEELPTPSYTVYGWVRRDGPEYVAVVTALADAPYAGRERYERRWDSRDSALAQLDWMARALADRVRRRGHELLGVEFVPEPPGCIA
ncbi:MAG TPA: hypothetical protein VFP44_24775 [Usitatibacter sp.]|nr:hypothetical protein [Usitatibacter sp.]